MIFSAAPALPHRVGAYPAALVTAACAGHCVTAMAITTIIIRANAHTARIEYLLTPVSTDWS